MSEILFIILMLGGFLVPALLFHCWWIFWVFLAFGCVFGAGEGISKAITGMTISQGFWAYSLDHPHKAWFILAGMLIAWLALLTHLSAKLWR